MKTKVPNNKNLILFVTSEGYIPKKVEFEINENYKKGIL